VNLPAESFTRIPAGTGGALTLSPYDANAGIPPGGAAIAFLGGITGAVAPCPIAAAVPSSSFVDTGIFKSFEITTDEPVAAYQINPFGGGAASTTGASLLLPTSVWDTDYVAVNAFAQSSTPPGGTPNRVSFGPSLNIVAREDDTVATIVPGVQVTGGGGIPAGNTGQPLVITLMKGEHAQITQNTELTGSRVSANKPIGLMAGHPCMTVPTNQQTFCDHGEQMIPPVRALGHTYVGVMYRPRAPSETQTFWRVIGVANGTQLTYSTPVGGPANLNQGQTGLFQTGTPFVVSSQDADHPFMLLEYMTGSGAVGGGTIGLGDPDVVVVVPPEQYLARYAFFTDPTYPETDLVVVRKRDSKGNFHDVTLDCAGTLTGWMSTGNIDFEYTRVDLTTGNFQNVGNCSTGAREMHSDVPFGLWIWGWGSGATTPITRNVSYAYPGGMKVQAINGLTF
jgi:IgGFc binding protein